MFHYLCSSHDCCSGCNIQPFSPKMQQCVIAFVLCMTDVVINVLKKGQRQPLHEHIHCGCFSWHWQCGQLHFLTSTEMVEHHDISSRLISKHFFHSVSVEKGSNRGTFVSQTSEKWRSKETEKIKSCLKDGTPSSVNPWSIQEQTKEKGFHLFFWGKRGMYKFPVQNTGALRVRRQQPHHKGYLQFIVERKPAMNKQRQNMDLWVILSNKSTKKPYTLNHLCNWGHLPTKKHICKRFHRHK